MTPGDFGEANLAHGKVYECGHSGWMTENGVEPWTGLVFILFIYVASLVGGAKAIFTAR